MKKKKKTPELKKFSKELKHILQLYSDTASGITADIEEAIQFAGSEEELKEILRKNLKGTKVNLEELVQKLRPLIGAGKEKEE